jgi:hypothetical protein
MMMDDRQDKPSVFGWNIALLLMFHYNASLLTLH